MLSVNQTIGDLGQVIPKHIKPKNNLKYGKRHGRQCDYILNLC